MTDLHLLLRAVFTVTPVEHLGELRLVKCNNYCYYIRKKNFSQMNLGAIIHEFGMSNAVVTAFTVLGSSLDGDC